jgi:ABC-type spermidine/putrescine transport system permease subunit I
MAANSEIVLSTETMKISARRRLRLDYVSITMIIGVLLYLAVIIVPLLVSFYFSFTNFNMLKATNSFVGVKNYFSLIADDTFLSTLIFTLKTSWQTGWGLSLPSCSTIRARFTPCCAPSFLSPKS